MRNTVIAVYYSPSFSRSSGLPDIYRHLKASPVARVQVSPCWQRQFSGRPGYKKRVYHNNLFTHHTSAIPLVKKMHWNFVYCYLPRGKLQGGGRSTFQWFYHDHILECSLVRIYDVGSYSGWLIGVWKKMVVAQFPVSYYKGDWLTSCALVSLGIRKNSPLS